MSAKCKYCGNIIFDEDGQSHGEQLEDGDWICHDSLCEELDMVYQDLKNLGEKYDSADFWNNWVYPDGANPEDVQSELFDYYKIMSEVSKVYDYITRGRISKPNTKAEEVISVYNDIFENDLEKEVNSKNETE